MKSISPLAARIRKEFDPKDFSHRAKLAEALETLDKNLLSAASSASSGKNYCQVYSSVGVNIPNAAATPIPFNSTGVENGGMHSNGTQNTRVTIFSANLYDIVANVQWPIFAAGTVQLQVRINGARIIGSVQDWAQAVPATQDQQVVGTDYLSVGDYVEIVATQNSGGALVIPNIAAYSLYAFVKEN